MAAPKVLLVIAHPVIASGIETLLKLEGSYDIKRAPTLADAVALHNWGPDVALVDGTLLDGHSDVRLGAPAYVLSGNERDGRALSHQLDDGRGWLRKDATSAELRRAIEALRVAPERHGGLGTLGTITVIALGLVVIALAAYLVWIATY